jgi:hypothetical protein
MASGGDHTLTGVKETEKVAVRNPAATQLVYLLCSDIFDGHDVLVQQNNSSAALSGKEELKQAADEEEKLVVVTVDQSTGKIIEICDEKCIRMRMDKGAKYINLRGHTLLPGLIDCHSHPTIWSDDYQYNHVRHSSAVRKP